MILEKNYIILLNLFLNFNIPKIQLNCFRKYVEHENLAKLDLGNDLVKLGKYIHSLNLRLFNTVVYIVNK